MKKGILYGVGVGPGDPDLITLKAVKAIGSVQVVFAASSTKNDYSLALNVVRDHLKPETEIRALPFPMTKSRRELNDAWEENAKTVLAVLDEGRDAAFITIGDPLTYSTFGYLLKTVLAMDDGVEVITIPGITSYNAAAARLNLILAEDKEALTIIPGTEDQARVMDLAGQADGMVILKVYKDFERICDALEELKLEDRAVLVSRCGHESEVIERDVLSLRGDKPHYMSLLIVKKERNCDQ